MIEKFIELNGSLEKLDIIEPCCGKGVFLLSLIAHGANPMKLYWNDINPVNVEYCNFLMSHYKYIDDNGKE